MLIKLNLPEKEKEKWMKVLTPDFQSSEESRDDDTIIAVRPLPWRSDRVSMKFNELDKKTDASKTPQARRQKRRRLIGTDNSTRCMPENAPKWSLC